ncbi:hypothetical protein ES703_22003 [subsurface metagenome]
MVLIPSLNSLINEFFSTISLGFLTDGILMSINGITAMQKVIRSTHKIVFIGKKIIRVAPINGARICTTPVNKKFIPLILDKLSFGTIIGIIEFTVGK